MENFVGRKIKKGWSMKPKAKAGSSVGRGTNRAASPKPSPAPQKKGGKAA